MGDERDPRTLNPAEMTQEQLVQLGEALLNIHKHQHKPGSYERTAYEGGLGLLGMFPHQPLWKRAWGKLRKRWAERRMVRMRRRA